MIRFILEYATCRFAYPSRPNVDVLKGVNLTVAPGKKLALVNTLTTFNVNPLSSLCFFDIPLSV